MFILKIDGVFTKNFSSSIREAFQRSGIEKKKDDNTIEIDFNQQKILLYEAEITCTYKLQLSQIEVKGEFLFLSINN